MANTKSPLLSLDARGSIGESLTYTKRRGQNIVEKKPELPYFLTLPVQYQRWLYQDYVYLWNQQTPAAKQVYATAGTRHHLTGFQYWMKYHLSNLPDLGAYWRLDYTTGAIAVDSSGNGNHGTIIGATPTPGAIDGAYRLDAINDYIDLGLPPFHTDTQGTLEFFLNVASGVGMFFTFTNPATTFIDEWRIYYTPAGLIILDLVQAGLTIWQIQTNAGALTFNQFNHVAISSDATLLRCFVDGAQVAFNAVAGANTGQWLDEANIDANRFTLGANRRNNLIYNVVDGIIDDVRYHSIRLDDGVIALHSAQRWP